MSDHALVEVVSREDAPISDELIHQVADEIRSLHHEATLGFALRLGALIIGKLYGGSFDTWRHRGQKDVSLSKLTELLPEALSVATVYRAVAIYELDYRLGGIATWKHLGVSHVRAVLALPEKDQRRLLDQAENKEWTVVELEKAVAKAKKKLKTESSAGRKPLPMFVKSLHHLKRFADDDDLLSIDPDVLNALDSNERESLQRTAQDLRERLDQVLTVLAGDT
jgi:hypothetical protein